MKGKKLPNYQRAKELAKELIFKHNIEGTYFSIGSMVEKEGLEVLTFIPDQNSNDVSGALMGKKIYVNTKDSIKRQRFTLAHELGHYLLGHNFEEEILYRKSSMETNDYKEKEANCFAANLLVDEDILIQAYDIVKDSQENIIDTLSSAFVVSHDVMSYRLKNFNVSVYF
jgi:Zn-dependent peptidase ImmA (M78 family)